MVVFDYSFSDEEFDMEDEEDIAMILSMHKNKRPKHGGLFFVSREAFHYRFWMSIDLFKHIAECVKLHNPFFKQRSCTEVLGWHLPKGDRRITHDGIWYFGRSCR
jgi:hypothetical protein